METNKPDTGSIHGPWKSVRKFLHRLHGEESGVAATEYIIVFTLITFGATLAVLATASFVKAYRDFLVWWFAHPAV